MSDLERDQKLIDDFIEGKRSALRQIEAIINGALTGWDFRSSDHKNDIKGDAILKLYEYCRVDNFRLQKSLPGLIATIVSRLSINSKRRWIKETSIDGMDFQLSEGSLEDHFEIRQDYGLAMRVVNILPEECARLWRMVVYDELPQRNIARIVGKSEEYIRWRIHDCRKRARKIREKLLKRGKQIIGCFA